MIGVAQSYPHDQPDSVKADPRFLDQRSGALGFLAHDASISENTELPALDARDAGSHAVDDERHVIRRQALNRARAAFVGTKTISNPAIVLTCSPFS